MYDISERILFAWLGFMLTGIVGISSVGAYIFIRAAIIGYK